MKNIIYCLLFCVGLICSSNSYGQTLDRNNLENKIKALIPTQLYSANEIRSGKVTLTINRLSAENYQPKLEYEGEVFTCFGDDTKPISIKIGTGASETWYHANDNRDDGCGKLRKPRLQKVEWNKEGAPVFGIPQAINTPMKKPSGLR